MPTTFSQLVDKMVQETKRPDLRVEIATYLNQTMRELHFEPTRNNAVYYTESYREAQLVASSESNYGWSAPNPAIFQGPGAAQFASVIRDGEAVWATPVTPGPGMRGKPYNYYRAGSTFFFSGYGGLNSVINWSWYEYVKSLAYYLPVLAPAVYLIESDSWNYLPAYDANDATRLAAQNLTTNWLLLRWAEVIEEGLRAKVYKRVGDDSRMRTAYSAFTALRNGIVTAETADMSGAG